MSGSKRVAAVRRGAERDDADRDGAITTRDVAPYGSTAYMTALPQGQLAPAASVSAPLSAANARSDFNIGFCGYRFNGDIGAYTVRFRHYDPTPGMCRWLERDPAGYEIGEVGTGRASTPASAGTRWRGRIRRGVWGAGWLPGSCGYQRVASWHRMTARLTLQRAAHRVRIPWSRHATSLASSWCRGPSGFHRVPRARCAAPFPGERSRWDLVPPRKRRGKRQFPAERCRFRGTWRGPRRVAAEGASGAPPRMDDAARCDAGRHHGAGPCESGRVGGRLPCCASWA